MTTLKTCTKCEIPQPETEFSIKKNRKTRNAKCKACQRITAKQHYKENVPTYVATSAKNKPALKQRNKDFVAKALEGCRCVICQTQENLTYYAGGPANGQPVHQAIHSPLSLVSVKEAMDRSVVMCQACISDTVYKKGVMNWGLKQKVERELLQQEKKSGNSPDLPRGWYRRYVPRTPAYSVQRVTTTMPMQTRLILA